MLTGNLFLIFDLGGMANFSVVQITTNYTLEYLHNASGGEWGGTNVNRIIFDIYKEIFGQKVMNEFKKMKAQLMEMDIELKKRDLNTEKKLSLEFSPTLESICRVAYNISCEELIKRSRYKDVIELKMGKIFFAATFVKDIFKQVVGEITEHMKLILNEPEAEGINTVILVGGFARSDFVSDFIKKTLDDKRIIIPTDPDLAVLKGAVKFGYFDWKIGIAVCGYTYGLEINRPCFSTDPVCKIKRIRGQILCTQVFERLVTIGDLVRFGAKFEKEFYASTEDMTKWTINIYRSVDIHPLFVTDTGCELFGLMTLQLSDIKEEEKNPVIISIQFGKNNITFSAKEKNSKSGHEIRLTRDCIW